VGERISVNDDFWDELLRHIRHQELVPAVRADLAVVKVGNTEQTFTTDTFPIAEAA